MEKYLDFNELQLKSLTRYWYLQAEHVQKVLKRDSLTNYKELVISDF